MTQQFGIKYKSPTNGKEIILGAWEARHVAVSAGKNALDPKKVKDFSVVVRDVSEWRDE
ncbi:hypothetical protein SEA_NANOSMITE_12 [Mycobacterium phage Nanosmite]|nr:hypothetical protein SEA_NANOSMITE_12 [Mycobacterium phage Nanosmite]